MRAEIVGDSPVVLGHVPLVIDQFGFMLGAIRVADVPVPLGGSDVTVCRPLVHFCGTEVSVDPPSASRSFFELLHRGRMRLATGVVKASGR